MSNRRWGASNGPCTPAAAVGPAPPASLRRTTTVDALRPDGVDGRIAVVGRGRDLLTDDDGVRQVLDEAWLEVDVEPDRVVVSCRWSNDVAPVATVGRGLGRGFRGAAVEQLDPDGNLRALVDDASIVGLLTSYAEIYARDRLPGRGGPVAGICAGWQEGGTLLTAVRTTDDIPLPRGPRAPVERDAVDGWHAAPPLAPLAIRRRRLTDVVQAGERTAVRSMFRDSFVDVDGVERVVHEYSVDASVDVATRTLVTLVATPRVLPWIESGGGGEHRVAARRRAGRRARDRRCHRTERGDVHTPGCGAAGPRIDRRPRH